MKTSTNEKDSRSLSGSSAWRTIESAPRDGTVIFAFWNTRAPVPRGRDHLRWGMTRFDGNWHNPDDHDDDYAEPAYWQPLTVPETNLPAVQTRTHATQDEAAALNRRPEVPSVAPTAEPVALHTAAEVRQAYEDGRASMTHLLPEKPTRGVLMTVCSAVDLATGGQLRLDDSVIELIYHNIRQATRLTAFHSKPSAPVAVAGPGSQPTVSKDGPRSTSEGSGAALIRKTDGDER